MARHYMPWSAESHTSGGVVPPGAERALHHDDIDPVPEFIIGRRQIADFFKSARLVQC
ncbi:MAG: hypothetical protein WBE71_04645 [Xanthobacteraceae bacterium]